MVFHFIIHLLHSSFSRILCHIGRHRADQLLTLRHVISLFSASEQTLGPSREYERDNGHAPEVRGPATTLSGAEQTLRTFCSWAEMCLNHVSSASATTQSTTLRYTFSIRDTKESLQPTAMDRHTRKMAGMTGNTFDGSYRVQMIMTPGARPSWCTSLPLWFTTQTSLPNCLNTKNTSSKSRKVLNGTKFTHMTNTSGMCRLPTLCVLGTL